MKLEQTFSAFLNAARWIAALAVVSGHARAMVLVNYAETEDKGLINAVGYFITGFGRQAVVVFFVISGFLVRGSVLHDLRAGVFSVKTYVIHRLSRLYPIASTFTTFHS